MPEFRKDPISGRWVIISVERGKRPTDFTVRIPPKKSGFCPFCEGNERTTPPEIAAIRDEGTAPDSPGWKLRVVHNKFPALFHEGELNKIGEGLFDKMNGIGSHEVIIESPDHNATFSNMPIETIRDTLVIFNQRIAELKKDSRFKYVLVFKNEGREAGASLEHSHSQLISLPIVPSVVQEELNRSKEYFDYKERCIFCDIIEQEKREGKRLIYENDSFVSIAPFAPRSPFETMILPKQHMSNFLDESNFEQLASILQITLKQIDAVVGLPPYNLMIHTSPFTDETSDYYHWHIEIKPKLTKFAGFEWGTGFYINPTPPEDAARFMREADI